MNSDSLPSAVHGAEADGRHHQPHVAVGHIITKGVSTTKIMSAAIVGVPLSQVHRQPVVAESAGQV